VKPISKANKAQRLQYSRNHKGKTLRGFWQWVYFTDEAHFNTRDLAARDTYDLRLPSCQDRLERLQEAPPSLNVTIHVSAGISYDHKGAFLFYNDPDEPGPKEYVYKPRKPRKYEYQSDKSFEQELQAWEARQPPKVDIKPKGNSMTQHFYTEHVLPQHIKHIKRLEARYSRQIHFQEDNDPSHGTRSTKNVARQLKDASQITTLIHPAQSPDFNPIEAIWRAIKQRLRGKRWTTVIGFKEDIEREWRRISLSSIRKRVSEMKWRCEQCIKLNGERVRSKLW
jgi:transposase